MRKLNETILIRISDKEHSNAKRMADKLGIPLSQYIRTALAQQVARDAKKD